MSNRITQHGDLEVTDNDGVSLFVAKAATDAVYIATTAALLIGPEDARAIAAHLNYLADLHEKEQAS